MEVTTTSARAGKFDARFYHLVFEEEFGRVKGHFGPINSLAFHPDGKGYASGGEDGYVRIHQFDSSYFDFGFDYWVLVLWTASNIINVHIQYISNKFSMVLIFYNLNPKWTDCENNNWKGYPESFAKK